MKSFKAVLLGSAAGLAAVGGASAADLPVKAKPVEYVKICSLYGPGFYYIPGTDTCIRIGGQIRAEISANARGHNNPSWLVNGDGNTTRTRDRDVFFVRNRVYISTDTRTMTAFGTLRTYSNVRFETNTGQGLVSGSGTTAIDTGMIQWGGFTIGRAPTSYFDNPWVNAYKFSTIGSYGWPDAAAGRFVAAYTHEFGNGISGTLSLEENKERRRGIYNGTNTLSILGVGPAANVAGGTTWPEIVGQLRIEQAWGGFHVAANLLNNHVAYNCGAASGTTTVAAGGCSELAGNVADRVGGGANAAIKFNLPTGVLDALYIGGSFGKGATPNVFPNNGPGSSFGIYGGTNTGAYGSLVAGYIWDSVYSSTTRTGAGLTVGPTGQQLTTTYGGSIAFEHGWNAEWRTSVFGGVAVIDYNGTANAILCSQFVGGTTSGTLVNAAGANVANTAACNFDYRLAGAGTRTMWTPVRDLNIALEFHWSNHHVGHATGTFYNQPVISGFKPNATYQVRDQNEFSGLFSVRRFF